MTDEHWPEGGDVAMTAVTEKATITERIKDLLDRGIPVYSCALGRVGPIVEARPGENGRAGAVRIRLGSGHQSFIGLTIFERGDPVELLEDGGQWVVRHPQAVWDSLFGKVP